MKSVPGARSGGRASPWDAGLEVMEFRRLMADLLGNPQLRGTITVERPWRPATTIPTTPSAPATSAVPARPYSPPPVSPQELLPNDHAVFHCRRCWAVLGDSLHLCAQDRRLGAVVLFKVSKEVTCEESLMVGLEGGLTGCTYNQLSCRSCSFIVGFVLYSTSRQLVQLRGLFCFFQHNILCYILKKQIIIEASKVNFPAVSFSEQVQELKMKIVKLNFRLELLMKKVEELAEKQNYVTGPLGLPPGYAIVRIH